MNGILFGSTLVMGLIFIDQVCALSHHSSIIRAIIDCWEGGHHQASAFNPSFPASVSDTVTSHLPFRSQLLFSGPVASSKTIGADVAANSCVEFTFPCPASISTGMGCDFSCLAPPFADTDCQGAKGALCCPSLESNLIALPSLSRNCPFAPPDLSCLRFRRNITSRHAPTRSSPSATPIPTPIFAPPLNVPLDDLLDGVLIGDAVDEAEEDELELVVEVDCSIPAVIGVARASASTENFGLFAPLRAVWLGRILIQQFETPGQSRLTRLASLVFTSVMLRTSSGKRSVIVEIQRQVESHLLRWSRCPASCRKHRGLGLRTGRCS